MNCIGVELCELIYRDRYLRDSALGRVEQAIRSLISADDYRPYHLQFTLKQTSEGRIPLPNRGRLLAALQELTDLMARGKDLASARGTTWVLLEEHLPEPCRTFLHMVALNNIGERITSAYSERGAIELAGLSLGLTFPPTLVVTADEVIE
jgi:hypothetical protein